MEQLNRTASDIAIAERVLVDMRSSPSSVSQEDVQRALNTLPAWYLGTRLGISMAGISGAPDWFEHESLVWELGEAVRSWLRARRIEKGKSDVLDALANLVKDRRYGKGRQNLVLILGEFGGPAYGDVFGELLGDPDVSGHAVTALVRSRIPGHVKEVADILAGSKTAWVKSAAKRYLSLMHE